MLTMQNVTERKVQFVTSQQTLIRSYIAVTNINGSEIYFLISEGRVSFGLKLNQSRISDRYSLEPASVFCLCATP